jgi:hypothetical protein
MKKRDHSISGFSPSKNHQVAFSLLFVSLSLLSLALRRPFSISNASYNSLCFLTFSLEAMRGMRWLTAYLASKYFGSHVRSLCFLLVSALFFLPLGDSNN